MKEYRRRILRLLPLVFVGYLALNVGLQFVGLFTGPRLNDFGTYYYAAERFLTGRPLNGVGIPPVPYAVTSQYMYPPVTVLVFVPFTVFPVMIAGVLWVLFSLASLFAGVWALLRSYDVQLSPGEYAVVFVSVLGFAPTITWMKVGQASGFLAALLCFSVAFSEYGRRNETRTHLLASGAVATVVPVFKPIYAPSGAHLLRDRAKFLGATLSAVVIVALSLLVFGIDTHVTYYDIVLSEGKGWVLTKPPSEWFATLFDPFYVFGEAAMYVRLGLLVAVLSAIVYAWRSQDWLTDQYVLVLGLVTIPLVGFRGNVPALNVLVPAYIVLFVIEYRRSLRSFLVPTVSLLLVQAHPYTIEFLSKFGPEVYPPISVLTPLVPILQPALWGCLLLFGYVYYRVVAQTYHRSNAESREPFREREREQAR